jgi:hypothetical protein
VRPVQHPSNNAVLSSPPGTTIEQCRPLPITRIAFDNGLPAVWSYWQPSELERRLIAEGKPVRLSCLGTTHPPIALGVDGDGA